MNGSFIDTFFSSVQIINSTFENFCLNEGYLINIKGNIGQTLISNVRCSNITLLSSQELSLFFISYVNDEIIINLSIFDGTQACTIC